MCWSAYSSVTQIDSEVSFVLSTMTSGSQGGQLDAHTKDMLAGSSKFSKTLNFLHDKHSVSFCPMQLQ